MCRGFSFDGEMAVHDTFLNLVTRYFEAAEYYGDVAYAKSKNLFFYLFFN